MENTNILRKIKDIPDNLKETITQVTTDVEEHGTAIGNMQTELSGYKSRAVETHNILVDLI